MYQIFESQLYFRQFILEAEPIASKIENIKSIVNDENQTSTTTNDENVSSSSSSKTEIKTTVPKVIKPKPKPPVKPDIPPEEDSDFPEDNGDNFDVTEPEPDPEATEKDKFQAIQKFIIYHKLRELQYKLDNLSTINSYEDKANLMKFTKFLSYVITFFSIFDYKQASKLSERILEEFKKIK